jgi:hypothetical protein
MKRTKVVLLTLFALFLIIQLIRPVRNKSGQAPEADISSLYGMPDQVHGIFRRACYDCHSNSTAYPWYANIQPLGWLLADHIREGKAELNFNEFGTYSLRKQKSKLKSIAGSIEDNSMPLSSYTFIHKNAKLSLTDKVLVLSWLSKTRDSISLNK